ncbi:APJA protein, partial [Atractosteus spatula]|nr:APJA protein [Atractosteus spatula]
MTELFPGKSAGARHCCSRSRSPERLQFQEPFFSMITEKSQTMNRNSRLPASSVIMPANSRLKGFLDDEAMSAVFSEHLHYFDSIDSAEGVDFYPEMEEDYDYYEDNETMCDYSEWEPSFSLIPVLYMLIFILGLSGNGVVIFTVWKSKSKRRAADIYIGNLALADLTFVITLPLWAVYTAMGYDWLFGVALCKISSYVVLVNMYASVFCLTCLSFDRYLAIVHSLSSTNLRSRPTMITSLGVIWLLSGVLAVPTLLFRTTLRDEANKTSCGMDFSLVTLNREHESLWIAGLSLSSSILGFLLPFLLMTVFYCFIGSTVTRHFNNLRKEDQKKQRLLKIITTLVAVFALCWTPFHVLKSLDAFIYLKVLPQTCALLSVLLHAHPYTTCLAYVNSCLNPFLYAFFDLRFRSQCLCLLNLKKAMHGQMSSLSSTLSAQTQKSEVQSLATKV